VDNVLYVPGLKRNLLSISQITREKEHLIVEFNASKCLIKDTSQRYKIVLQGIEEDGMYMLDISKKLQQSLKIFVKNEGKLWHERYGHLNFTYLNLMHKLGMVIGLPNIQHDKYLCEAFLHGKQSRDHFEKQGAWRERKPLELIHSDLCGPMQTLSIGGSKYFLSFIDDFSRKIWVYFLKNKFEVFEKFQEFKIMVEKEFGQSIKTLISDNGGEFKSNDFMNFCKYHGIKRQFTTPYTPQQNGVAERKNRTIVEMARSMLQGSKLGNQFWEDVVHTSIYLLNRSPTKVVRNVTPEELWSGRKPRIGHLKIFGSTCYMHIPKEKRRKLDNKSKRCIFVGYSDYAKAYRLYDEETNDIIISRDVKFDETQRIETSQTYKGKEKVCEEEENTSIIESPSSSNNNLDDELSSNVTHLTKRNPTWVRKTAWLRRY